MKCICHPDVVCTTGIDLYEEALLHDPTHGKALYNLAVACGEARQLKRAAVMYEMTILVSPDCAEAHNNLGVIHRELNNFPKAMQCYMAALQIRPNFPQALNNLAVIYTSQASPFPSPYSPTNPTSHLTNILKHASILKLC